MNLCKLYLPKKTLPLYNEEEDPQKTHLTLDGLEGRDSPSTYPLGVVEEVVMETGVVAETVEEGAEEEEEEEIQEIKMTEDPDQS